MEKIIRAVRIKHPDLNNYYVTKDGRIFNSKKEEKNHMLKMDI